MEWERWLAEQDDETQERARQLLERFRALVPHLEHPEVWVRSELREDIPQLTSIYFLRQLWEATVEEWISSGTTRIGTWDLPQKILAGQGTVEELAWLCGQIASETLRSVIYVLDNTIELDDDNLPGWRLVEVDRRTGKPTGRDLDALHELLIDAPDPGDPFL